MTNLYFTAATFLSLSFFLQNMLLTPAEKQRGYREQRRKEKIKKKDCEHYHNHKKLIKDMSGRKKRAQ